MFKLSPLELASPTDAEFTLTPLQTFKRRFERWTLNDILKRL
jgi:hypothetical protein